MTDHNVIAELSTRPTAALADRVLEQLADFAPAVARSPRGRAEVVLTVPADGLRQAVASSLALLATALAGTASQVLAVEAMTTKEFDARTDRVEPPAMPELVSVSEAAQLLGVTRQAVAQRIDTGSLPATRVGTTWVLPRAAVVPPQ